jgi:membrane protease YdiL (CAAX protease family)
MGVVNQEHGMSGPATNFKSGEYRGVFFWLLLLGSWQFLASPGSKNAIIGALGAAGFLVYAWANLDRLRTLGLDHASWRSAPRANWELAGVSGILAGIVVFAIGTASGKNMRLGDNWELIALQVTLGPVLEEVVFRGYLFALLMWLLTRVASDAGRNRLAVVFAAVIFAVVHLAQPGVSWLQLACITCTGTLYGWIRCRSGSTAPAAVSHAVYNLVLYAISGAVLLGEKALSSP